MLLLSVGVLELYGSWLAWNVLSPKLRERARTGEIATFRDSSSFRARFVYLLVEAVSIGGFSVTGVGLLALLTAPLPLALLAYHMHLIWTGMTTNETVKWSDWREDMADGVVFKARRSEVLAMVATGGFTQKPYINIYGEINATMAPNDRGNLLDGSLNAGDPGEVHVDWPIESDQFLVRTANGQPPGTGQSRADIWKRCWRLNDVDHIYDLGFWDNLWDVLRG